MKYILIKHNYWICDHVLPIANIVPLILEFNNGNKWIIKREHRNEVIHIRSYVSRRIMKIEVVSICERYILYSTKKHSLFESSFIAGSAY